ncbi:UPF0158 family protein [Paenibacillus alkaliterrae]|uniref:UPF0158 family protein n=1 Tax=Paenibacillus alkaliterrae TaxID=320909 RepID=UPI001F39504E|nr:UPF0158 family protein [Paenibacillus alkaliterrae]MCF2937182.1 UPF0158 family protein [Paenibacillus alkaliterrae]
MKNNKRKFKNEQAEDIDQDDTFYFIAGYTDGGAPFGITWEEHEADKLKEAAGGLKKGDSVEMKELQLTKRQLQEIIEDFDMQADGIEFYLNVETGDVVTLNTLGEDEEDEEWSEIIDEGFNEIYFQIPAIGSDEGFEDMVFFTAEVSNEKLRTKLMTALNGGRGVFRRFKNVLSSDAGEQERYYAFVEERNRERVLEWLQSIGFRATILE